MVIVPAWAQTRAKNDALWAMLRLRHPAIRYRIMWLAPTLQGYESAQSGEYAPRFMSQKYDAVMLAATVVGSAAPVIAS